MRKILKLVVFMLVVWCLVIPGNSRADLIPRIYSIGSLTFPGSGLNQIGVKPFDPSLGTLDEVIVSIDEFVYFSGLAVSQAGYLNYSFNIDQIFFGMLDKYFDFSSFPIEFLLSGTGLSEFPVSIGFAGRVKLDFGFTAASDIINQATIRRTSADLRTASGDPSPTIVSFPVAIEGKRSDFLKTFVPVDEIDVIQRFRGMWGLAEYPTFNAAGTMEIIYYYTPTPTPAPEPSLMVLLSISVLSLAGIKRWWKE